MINFKQKFGNRLKELRKLRGISQETLAEMIDITPRNLSKIETGQTFPSADNLEKIIRKLDCKPYTLFKFCIENKTSLKKQIAQKIENLAEEQLEFVLNFIEMLK